MRTPSAVLTYALLLALCAGAAQARPATFLLAHAAGMTALPAPPARATPPQARPLQAPPPQAAASRVFAPPQAEGGRARYLALVAREAEGAGLPVAVADAVARIESGYDPTVIGGVGEIGLMQVRPATAAMLGFRGTDAELAVPEVNVRYGVRYLAQAWRLAEGDLCRALMKYRAGHGAEAMSPLSQLYCARAQAILAGAVPPPPARARREPDGAAEPPRRWAAVHPGPARAVTGPPPTFWEAHRARIARLNARVQAAWRARGWKPG